jgi:hypothetical protein
MPEHKVTIEIATPPTHCSQCKGEYVNHQHPAKPAGVIMMRTCRCVVVTETDPGYTNTRLVPPSDV